jgi:hypothetical protein
MVYCEGTRKRKECFLRRNIFISVFSAFCNAPEPLWIKSILCTNAQPGLITFSRAYISLTRRFSCFLCPSTLKSPANEILARKSSKGEEGRDEQASSSFEEDLLVEFLVH